MKKRFKVSSREKGVRLLAFLREVCPPDISVKSLKRRIEAKHCKINGRVETFSTHILKEGDSVEMEWDADEPFQLKPILLWEDGAFIVYDKPAGMVCDPHAFPGHLIHRLDKDTTGVVLVAKTQTVLEQMIELFRKRKVQKEYLALVDGLVLEQEKTIISKLASRHHYQGQTLYGSAPKGQEAITQWKLLAHRNKASLILCHPITGRTHQLRVHCKEAGHPILGDYQYARTFQCAFEAKRHLLHAYKIAFPHPLTQAPMEIIAPIPLDFQTALERLGMAHAIQSFDKEKEHNSRDPRK